MSQVQRTYFPDGSVEFEVTIVEGLPHGVTRHWHPNGVLAAELSVRHGIPEAVSRQWSEKGELLGSFEIRNGTGTQCVWHPNGQLMGELSWVDGKWNGRQRAYFDDGALAGETYWLENEKVPKKRYLEACEQNPNLPRYEVRVVRSAKSETAERVNHPAVTTTDELLLSLLQGPRVREASAWLQESRHPSRSLGEATGQDESIRLVEKLYSLGAVTVHAVGIEGKADEDQNAGRVVVELPQEQGKRGKLLKFCGTLAREAGFDQEPDLAQRYVLLTLD